ncbi:hypothetical protein BS47DRAFT_226716 [Hydnum rufescens UP504]|uniref:SNF2 N-terminal domain-containing protein n=1 Tax=Hydnum rufescens UP504 TaxID=1448309 RepID=A0A9P6E155_9AGAM|nr:hypothetical protein BS47DRAFT_226716 [Hydnum rufescens UP504]
MNFILPKYFRDALESLRAIFKVRASSHTSLLSESRVSRASKMMTPFVLRRRKDQVLKDLPKKTERIEWCETTPLQRTIYEEAMQRSRSAVEALPKDEKALLEIVAEPDDEIANGNGDGKSKGKTRPKKGVLMTSNASGSNVLMELRKASCHPMLFRRLFDDAKINLIARHCLQEPDFQDSSYDLVVEDMQVMNDAELQRFCLQYKSVRKHALDNSCFLDAGKVTHFTTPLGAV